MIDYACLFLPFPPSVNGLFIDSSNKRGRSISKRYEEWRIEATRAMDHQAPIPFFKGPFTATFSFGKPDKRKRDVTNYIKAPEDFLVEMGVIQDDSLAECVTAKWDKNVVGVRIEIEGVV